MEDEKDCHAETACFASVQSFLCSSRLNERSDNSANAGHWSITQGYAHFEDVFGEAGMTRSVDKVSFVDIAASPYVRSGFDCGRGTYFV